MASEEERSVVGRVCKECWGVEAKAWARDEGERGGQWASSLVSGVATLEVPLVVKRKPKEEFKRKVLKSDDQFHNEVLVYESVLPLLGAQGMAPRMYLGVSGRGEEDVVALGRAEGFGPCRQRPFLDTAHLALALEALGKFHGLSYRAKAEGRLPGPAARLRPVGFAALDPEEYVGFLTVAMRRAVGPAPDCPEAEEFSAALGDLPRVVRLLESPPADDSLSVVAHGDFCSNNLLFRYSPGGTPAEVLLIDFQTSRYASPALDLSFFLYLNTSHELRSASWDLLFEAYFDSMEAALRPCPGPSREELLLEFARRAPYGLLHASFFLPVMLAKELQDWNEDNSAEDMASQGGEETTRAVSQIFNHMLEKGYVRAFLDVFNAQS